MPAKKESLRTEAARRSVTVSRVRQERAVQGAIRRGERIPSAWEASGHHKPMERTMSSFMGADATWHEYKGVNRSEARRLARYDSLAGQSVKGRISDEEFHRRVASWKPFRGERFASDGPTVRMVVEARREREEEIMLYTTHRRR